MKYKVYIDGKFEFEYDGSINKDFMMFLDNKLNRKGKALKTIDIKGNDIIVESFRCVGCGEGDEDV